MTDQHIATALFAFPFLALCAGGLIAQVVAIRSEVARMRRVRVRSIIAKARGETP